MSRTLKQVIEDWEQKNMITVGTASGAKSGRLVKPLMARQIAKAFGADEREADEIAAQYATHVEAKETA